MLKFFKNKKGFSLIELLFGVAIFIIIAGALTLFSRNIWFYGSYVSNGLMDSNYGKTALKTMLYEIRGAATAANGAYPIATATSNSFTFYSDIDNDNVVERVRYFLNGTNLQKAVLEPSGSPLAYTAAETISTLAPNVTNTTIFDFYDENYDGSTAALSAPVTISSIRLVKITLTIDKDVNRAPTSTTLSTQVSIRSLKDNL